jgi:hypothetical protein
VFKYQLDIINKAVKAVPAVKYAIGVAGIGAAASIVYALFNSPQEAIISIVCMIVLMVLLLIFARVASLKHNSTKNAAIFAVWGILLLFIASCIIMFTAIFFDWPKSLNELFGGKSAKENLPQLVRACVEGKAEGSCYAELRGSATQLFERGCLIAKFDENILIAIVTKSDGSLEWYKTKENFQKGVPVICSGIENDTLLRLGFRWWYCSEIFSAIQPKLGNPLNREIKAWVQYQQWSDGLLFFGVPHTAVDYERDHFQRLLGGFLSGYNELSQGSGKFFTITAANVNNAYCTAFWFPANPNQKMTEKQKGMDCQSLSGPDVYTRGLKICDFGN